MEEKKRNKKGLGLMLAGLLLVAAAVGLVLYNRKEDERAGEQSELILTELEKATSHAQLESLDGNMPMITIDGRDIVGHVIIDSLEIDLPVLAYWDEEAAKDAPARYTGSVWLDNMVLCGHNYRRHFAPLHDIETGAEVRFVDVNGNEFVYEVTEIFNLGPKQVLEMISGEDWDLTLFTCTMGGQSRITVRCVRKKSIPAASQTAP